MPAVLEGPVRQEHAIDEPADQCGRRAPVDGKEPDHVVRPLDGIAHTHEIRLERLRQPVAVAEHEVEVERTKIDDLGGAAALAPSACIRLSERRVEALGIGMTEEDERFGCHAATLARESRPEQPRLGIDAMHGCMPRPPPALGFSRWDDVRFFLAASRSGSFTLAARALGTDQSTVSRRMAALESEIGAPLFERTPRGPVATELGIRLREDAERVESEMLRLADTARGGEPRPQGRVRLATIEAIAIHFIVPRVLPILARAHPEIDLQLKTGVRALDLANQEADVAVRFFRTARGDLIGRRVARLPVVAISRRSLARKLRGRAPSTLPWISVDLEDLETPEAAWLAAHAGPSRALRCNNYEVQLAAIRAGLGVGLAPRAALSVHPDLVALEGLPPGPTLELYVVTRRAIRALPRVAAVIDLVTEHLGALDGT